MIERGRWFALTAGSLAALSAALLGGQHAQADASSQTREVAERLRPIADSEWQQIAGERAQQSYPIAAGDTLWGISNRLFGDSRYWPKIWSLNNAQITNPHLIVPGNQVTFTPGSGGQLPSVAISSVAESGAETEAGSGEAESPEETSRPSSAADGARSQEWRKLPPQPWERVNATRPVQVDPDGFDRRSRFSPPRRTGFDLPVLAYSRIPVGLGVVVGARSAAANLTQGDIVYVRASGEVAFEIGQTYAVIPSEGRELLTVKKHGRAGYSYTILGTLELIAEEAGTFAARITGNRAGMIPRGAQLVAVPPRIFNLDPVAGVQPLEARVVLDRNFSTFASAQFKPVFLDRGTDDGVQPNMVFRMKHRIDPNSQRKLLEEGLLRDADIIVVQTSERVSLGIIDTSQFPILEGAVASLLLEVDSSRSGRKKEIRSIDPVAPPAAPSTAASAPEAPAAATEPNQAPPQATSDAAGSIDTPESNRSAEPVASPSSLSPGSPAPTVSPELDPTAVAPQSADLPSIETLDQDLDGALPEQSASGKPDDLELTLE